MNTYDTGLCLEYSRNLKILSRRFSMPARQVIKELRRGVGYDYSNAGDLPFNPNRERLTDRELVAWAVRETAQRISRPE